MNRIRLFRCENVENIVDIFDKTLSLNSIEKQLILQIINLLVVITGKNIFPSIITTQCIVNNLISRIVKIYDPNLPLFTVLQSELENLGYINGYQQTKDGSFPLFNKWIV